jgi:hypothetical protein
VKPLCATVALLCSLLTLAAAAQGVLENPAYGSAQSGISVISGWHCSASRIDIVIDDLPPLRAGTQTDRADTLGVCGRKDTGFSLLFNWSLLPTHCFGCRYHTVRAYADGVQFGFASFEVAKFDTEYLTGKLARYSLPNFPEIGDVTTLQWDEEKQNFSVWYTSPRSTGLSGTYYGAMQIGSRSGICGPPGPGYVQPVRHGTFSIDVDVRGRRMWLRAVFEDGASCNFGDTPLLTDMSHSNGYVSARFPASAAAACPAFTASSGDLVIRTNGTRMSGENTGLCNDIRRIVGTTFGVDR